MQGIAEPVARLIEELTKLPAVGPKTAQRLAYHLLRAPAEQATALARAIIDVKERIIYCSVCQNITEHDPCGICVDPTRDREILCVVEEPLDVLAIERTRQYKGLYHVIHGVISPMNGIGPEELKIDALVNRLRDSTVRELILATNPNLEGEVTAHHIQRLVDGMNVRVTRLARGLPVGGDLEYADEVTLARAFEGRREM